MTFKTQHMGLLEWFHLGEYDRVEATLAELKTLPFARLRTGLSWADYHSDEGKSWFNWLIPKLAREVELLPCFLYTPPSLGLIPKTSSPPREPKAYADFLDEMVSQYGSYFEHVELWNEPNNLSEYDFTLDQDWQYFCEMIGAAAYWMKQRKKMTVLGGMAPVDPNWLRLMFSRGIMSYIDAVGIHHFPGVFDDRWEGWEHVVKKITSVILEEGGSLSVWITETGFSTLHYRENEQLLRFLESTEAPVERVYWYGLRDLDEKHPTVDGYHLDEREYFFGMKRTDGRSKLLYRQLATNTGAEWGSKFRKWSRLANESSQTVTPRVLLIGGSCFEATHLAASLLSRGNSVEIFDLPADSEAFANLEILSRRFSQLLTISIADARNRFQLQQALAHASFVYYFLKPSEAGSETTPDFRHLDAALNLLEYVRTDTVKLPVVYISRYQVYGPPPQLGHTIVTGRHENKNPEIMMVPETTEIAVSSVKQATLHSLENFFLTYATSYKLKISVVRLGETYGRNLSGSWHCDSLTSLLTCSEDMFAPPANLKSTRDWLAVEDLVSGLLSIQEHITALSGNIFNIGGGPTNSASYLDILRYMSPDFEYAHINSVEAVGKPDCFICDIQKLVDRIGWRPLINWRQKFQ